jgi:hypothetical protein
MTSKARVTGVSIAGATVMGTLALMLLGVNFTATAANAQDVDRTPSPAKVYDLDGNLLEQITVGHQVILSQTFVNDRNVPQSYVGVIEVRDSNGFTVYLAWATGTMAPGGQASIGVSWVASDAGEYEIRTFPLSSLTTPEVLDTIESRSITVVESS